jgi:serine/threonine protein kinase
MPLDPGPIQAGTTFAGYTIVRRLGSGGMGEVYLARHPRLPRQDALKVLRAAVSAAGDVPSPTVTVDPTEQPLPVGLESPIRVCMQQTGQTRRECREDIRRSNEMP